MLRQKSFKVKGPKPKGLHISRDESGVPHIKAMSYSDALWGSGYAHAADRGMQMLMMRILGQGRLAELLSDTEESVAIDRFFKRANWSHNVAQQVALLDASALAHCQSYCDGVNAGLAAHSMSVIRLLGYEPEPWKISDGILISRMTSYLTLAQSQAEVERFFIELTQAGVSTEALAELFPINAESFDRALLESIQLEEKIVPNEVIWNLALPRMMASNNWVVSGAKTESGHAIMANDPHLEVNRLPNVWCEQSLSWGDAYLIGMGIPGLPGIMIGRNEHVAWGATYTFMDTVDSWVEKCQNGQFYKADEWHDFQVRTELIKRKKGQDILLCFYENEHGVLEGDPSKPGNYLATRWMAQESGAQSIMASLKMAEAHSCKEAMLALQEIESAWNWVIADSDDNIAYQMSGLMPKRNIEWNGFTPAPGWDASYDWQGAVETSALPSSYNPECGYLVTANQDLNHLGEASPINMPMGDYRAKRIEEVLSASDQHDVQSTQDLQMDVYSRQSEMFLGILLPLLEAHGESSELYERLKNWDCQYDIESVGAPVFEMFYQQLRQEVFGRQKNGLGEAVIQHLANDSGLFIDFYQNFDRILLSEESVWYQSHRRDEFYLKAFAKVKEQYTSRKDQQGIKWKEINNISLNNILFQGKLPTFLGFDTAKVPLRGGRATPHQGQIYQSAGRQTSFAPSVRIIAQMNDDVLHTSLAGGPSDSRFSPWYTSGLQDWVNGVYKRLHA